MPDNAVDETAVFETAVYDIDYQLESSHHHAVELMRAASVAPGVVLDLGCGYGPHAESVRELGLHYVGLDIDPAGLRSLTTRGFETHPVDLLDVDGLPATLLAALAGRELRFVAMLDVLEHLVDPTGVLQAVRAVLPPDGEIVVSLPNVTHVDVALQLLRGRFEPTPSGLLDATHLRWFSGLGVARLLGTAGFRVTARHDVIAERTELANPVDDPVLGRDTHLNRFLLAVRGSTAPESTTYQFVFRAAPAPVRAVPPAPFPEPNPPEGVTIVVDDNWSSEQRTALVADVAAIPGAEIRVVARDPGAATGSWGDANVHADLRGLAAAARRWVMVLAPGTRLDPALGEALAGHSDGSGGRLIRFGATDDRGAVVEQATLDPSRSDAVGPLVPGAVAVPALVMRALWPPAITTEGEAHVLALMSAARLAGLGADERRLVTAPATAVVDDDEVQRLLIASGGTAPVLLPTDSMERLTEQTRRLKERDSEVVAMSLRIGELDAEMQRLRDANDDKQRHVDSLQMRVDDLETRTRALIAHQQALESRLVVRLTNAVYRVVRRARRAVSGARS